MRREPQQASGPRLTPEEEKRACGKGDRLRYKFLRGRHSGKTKRGSARPIRKSGRGAAHWGLQAGARATHRGHTLTHDGRDRPAGMSPVTAEWAAFVSSEPEVSLLGISFGRRERMAHAWVAFLLAPARPGVFEPKKTSGGAGTHTRVSVVLTCTGTGTGSKTPRGAGTHR